MTNFTITFDHSLRPSTIQINKKSFWDFTKCILVKQQLLPFANFDCVSVMVRVIYITELWFGVMVWG